MWINKKKTNEIISAIKHEQFRIKWNKIIFPELKITEGIKPYHGVNNVLTHYNIIWDPYLGIGRCEIKIISYLCIDFINVMDLSRDQSLVPKAQPRYSSVKNNIIQY